MRRNSAWKIIGLAGLAGVAATGVVIVRSERRRRAYEPEEVRARLHQRVAAIAGSAPSASLAADPPPHLRRSRHRPRRSFSVVHRG
jgi:hypothetical protein